MANKTASRSDGNSAAPVERRLPGKPRSRAEVLRELQDSRGVPMPYELYRWRVQLDCGDIIETLTRGDQSLLDHGPWPDPFHRWARLPDGEMQCHLPPASHGDPQSRSHPYREIAQWHDDSGREEIDPADPIEPPDWWGDLDADAWAKVRHDERTVKRWRVTLSCGDATAVVVADSDWKPADGHRRVSAEEQQRMTTRLEEAWAAHPEFDHGHERRMLAYGWPKPPTETICYTCPRARRIVAYQRIGWLARQPKLETKTIDLDKYEQRGDPDQPVCLTKRHEQDQANSERIRDHVRKMLDEYPPPPLSDETARRLADLLFAPAGRRRASELMRWRLRLYCGHIVERTAHYTHQTVHNAFTGSISCPQCGLDPATIVAARPLGRQVDPEEPTPPKPSRETLEKRLRRAEADAARLREQLAGLYE